VAARALAVDDAPSEEALASDVLESVAVDLDSELEAAVEVAFDSMSETPEMSDSPSEEGSV
jgi:hypothetical protein